MAQGLQVALVTMESTQVVRLEQQASVAVGGVKFHAWPLLTVRLLAQVSTGAVGTTVTVWSQKALLLHPSVIFQIRVMIFRHVPLVMVSSVVMSTLLLQQEEAIGRSNVQFESHGTVLLVGQ